MAMFLNMINIRHEKNSEHARFLTGMLFFHIKFVW
jgi:hypothetical protein